MVGSYKYLWTYIFNFFELCVRDTSPVGNFPASSQIFTKEQNKANYDIQTIRQDSPYFKDLGKICYKIPLTKYSPLFEALKNQNWNEGKAKFAACFLCQEWSTRAPPIYRVWPSGLGGASA